MPQQPQAEAARQQTTYSKGDMVLFRDVEKFWLGKPGHTFIGRVERAWQYRDTGKDVYDLIELSHHRRVAGISPEYMRLLPPADAMADIDIAPLGEPDAGAMTPASVAWLRQHLAQASSTLPAERH
ncbi:hypothetical protein [Streptomyces sp. RK75]|uniref:hypothetical protein n=1 Tax=Streptomyces sp. RK75 TaxID=2824895 RepID=UPI001B38C59B|nr:hypothetical protein [Streptomyces sp. RK75]MBQ0867390.1 hypothetical protein [Streptomyces sp. RK75]